MPDVRECPKDIVAVFCADLHLSHRPPIARSCENWYAAMARQLMELDRISRPQSLHVQVPILCAGDVLNRWNEPAELVNFAIRHLPKMYAVPGQHDQPHHLYKDLHRSAYWTLVEAGIVTDLRLGKPVELDGGHPMRLHGFPFGFFPRPLERPHDLMMEIAVVHQMVWTKNTGFRGAPEDRRASAYIGKLRGYDVAVFGDNHIPCHCMAGDCRLWNCGGFFRRNADQVGHRPSVGLLHADGTITRHYLDCSKDKFIAPDALKALDGGPVIGDVSGFLEEVAGLQDAVADFREAVERFMSKERVPEAVRTAVLQAMEAKP